MDKLPDRSYTGLMKRVNDDGENYSPDIEELVKSTRTMGCHPSHKEKP
jgi:hypothetical protein